MDVETVAAPDCDVCLHPLEATGRVVPPWYWCPWCGHEEVRDLNDLNAAARAR